MRLPSVLGCLAVVFVARGALAQSDSAKAQALARFQEGITLHDKGQEEEAYLRFTQAYAVVQTPPILFNLARTEQLTGRLVDAAGHFRTYAAFPEHPKVTPEFRAKARAYLAELEARLGRLTVDAPTGASVLIDGKDAAGAVLDVLPGNHTVVARSGEQQASVQVTATAGAPVAAHLVFVTAPLAVTPVVVVPVPLPPPQEEHAANHTTRNVVVGATAGVAVVGLAVGVGFLVDARSQASDFNSFQTANPRACANASSALCAEAHTKDSNVSQSSVISDVGFVVGGVAAVTSAALWLLWPTDTSKPSATTWVRPNVGLGSWTVDVGGRF